MSALDDAKLAFEIHHEMTYHEMCDVLAALRAENVRLRGLLQGYRTFCSPDELAAIEHSAALATAVEGETP